MLEIALTTPAALECITRIAAEVEGAIVGAGNVLTAKDLKRATRAGAHFAASPGFSARLSNEAEIPLLPGCATATEIMRAHDHGHDCLKLFPAEIAGGLPALHAFLGAFPDTMFCPTGSLTPETAPLYLALPNVISIGGTWIAPPAAQRGANWDHIAYLAHEAAALRTP